MSEERKNRRQTGSSSWVQPFTAQPARPTQPDFEYNLAEFELEFFEFVAETDPNFDLERLRHNPTPPVTAASQDRLTEAMYPTTKEELGLPLHLSGPRVVNGDVLGDQIVLETEVRVRGCVYGRASVQIGASCVIEGSVVSGGPLLIKSGSRIEGAVIGQEVKLNGPIQVEGPVYSRENLYCQGRVEAQSLYANGSITLNGNPKQDEVRLETGLIVAKAGDIETQIPVWLADVEVESDRQKFYFRRDENGELQLMRAASATLQASQGQSTILTTLTDAELEKLISETPDAPGRTI